MSGNIAPQVVSGVCVVTVTEEGGRSSTLANQAVFAVNTFAP